MKKYVLSPWFNVKKDGPPQRSGFYEGIAAVLPGDRKVVGRKFYEWNGRDWTGPGNDVDSISTNAASVLRWRGVIPDRDYPFDKIHSVPEKPEILSVTSAVHHSQWSFYHADYGLAATTKLILDEAIEYVEALDEYSKVFDALDEVSLDLNELLSSLEDANNAELLVPEDELAEPVDGRGRRADEAEYAKDVQNQAHGFVDLVDLVEMGLPDDDEFEEFDLVTKFAVRQLRIGIINLSRLLDMFFEG